MAPRSTGIGNSAPSHPTQRGPGTSATGSRSARRTGSIAPPRQPALPRGVAQARQPAFASGRTPAPERPRTHQQGRHGPLRADSRADARNSAQERAQARVRHVDPARVRESRPLHHRAARGDIMDHLSLPLLDLHERHARLARVANKSEKTIAWYRGALEDFCRYLEGPAGLPAALRDFTLEHVRDYILHLRVRPSFERHPFKASGRPLSDHSVNCYVRGLRAFSSWLNEQEYTDVNLLGRLRAPRVTQKAVEILTDEEITRILACLSTSAATNVRNRAIFLTLLDTGIRASELLTLTIPRAHLDEGYLLVLGKGRKERPVKIGTTPARKGRTLCLTLQRKENAHDGHGRRGERAA